MKKIIIYGAGKRGKRYAKTLIEHGISVEGFCDSYKTGNVMFEYEDEQREWPIFNLNDIDRNQYTIIIAIENSNQYQEVERRVKGYGINVSTIERILFQDEGTIEANRKYVAESHIENMNSYFELAEGTEALNVFWEKGSIFNQIFQELDLARVVELACGRGRHVQKYIESAQNIILVDILEKNIDYCKKRFGEERKISYYVNNGYDLSQIHTDSCTALFTYDSMVHFEMLDIFQYLKETKRILAKGGKALFHHSNNTENYKVTFSTGKHGRNYMSKQLFAYLANRAELTVIKQIEIDWDGEEKLDCITLVGNM